MKRATLLLAVCAAEFSLNAYQTTMRANCELRAAYDKSIDWNATLQFATTDSSYDANLGGMLGGRYWLDSDLVTGRLFIDRKTPSDVELDLGDGRTMTILGYSSIPAINYNSSGSVVTLKSGRILLPASYPGTQNPVYSAFMAPRANNDSYGAHDTTFVVGGGASTAMLDAQEIHYQYGTNNLLVVTNNGIVSVSGTGTRIGTSYSTAANPYGVLATGNCIRVTSGGVYSNSNVGASITFSLFGLSGCAGNAFEVVNGGRLEGWARFDLAESAGNTLAFRGAETSHTFDTTNGTPSTIKGHGTRLEITDGASLRLKDSVKGSGGRFWLGNGGCSNMILVAGNGSTFTCESTGPLIGQKNTEGNVLEVRDGGKVRADGVYIGREGSKTDPTRGNVVRVVRNGSFTDALSMMVGYGDDSVAGREYSCSNRLEIASGGSVSVGEYLTVSGGSNSWANAIDVSAGTLTVGSSLRFSFRGQSSVMSVRDGGKVTVGGAVQFGQESGAIASNCVMEVLSGAEIAAGNEFIVSGRNHMLAVSNGMIRTTSSRSRGIQLPSCRTAGRDSDFTIAITGTNPVIRAEGTSTSAEPVLTVRGSTEVDFTIPQGGYVAPPFQTPIGKLGFIEDSLGNVPDLRFDVSACTKGLVRCVIARGDTLQVADSVLAHARANLPENCRLLVVGNELVLKVGKAGFCMHLQ